MTLKLHFYKGGHEIYINFNHVKAFVQTDEGTRIVVDWDKGTLIVNETATEIYERLKGANNEVC